jgi:hypothetical protein
MKALTLWQPWASLIVAGVKPYEFRGWRAPASFVGQRIGIHAGKRPVRRGEIADLILRLRDPQRAWSTALRPEALPHLERWHSSPGELPLSSVLCTAVLGKPLIGAAIVAEFGGDPVALGDRSPDPLNDSDRDEHCNWAWPLTDIKALVPIVPAMGSQGFWDWTPEFAA